MGDNAEKPRSGALGGHWQRSGCIQHDAAGKNGLPALSRCPLEVDVSIMIQSSKVNFAEMEVKPMAWLNLKLSVSRLAGDAAEPVTATMFQKIDKDNGKSDD